MDIKQNIVRIKTGLKMGTGILYPCETSMENPDKSRFVIFTNRHVVEDIEEENEKINTLVEFDIYDKNGKLIDNDSIDEIKLFVTKNKENTEDIAAFLLVFKHKINIDLERKIVWDDKNINDICIEGFPRVLFDNEISSKIQLMGKYKTIFPKNEKIGIFKISDDYHWYSNYKDLKLFQGFSGSPIYSSENGSNFIVGMNRSMLNIDDGENPFKLLYYYKIKFVLEYLREQDCIIFKRNEDGSISIRWIDKEENKEKEINLLLLGSSGAGKSSFAKTFLLHSKAIDSTNDGQTTRSNIIYELALKEKGFERDEDFESEEKVKNKVKYGIKIKFLNKEQFVERMEQINYANYLLKVINIVKKKNMKSLEEYLQYILLEEKTVTETKDDKKAKIKQLLLQTDEMSLQEREDYYGKICDTAEEFIEDEAKGISGFIEKNKDELKQVLEKAEGFFDIKEFNYLNNGETINIENNETILKDKVALDKNNDLDLDKYFKNYYGKVHEKIIEILKREKIVQSNNFSLEISFNDEEKLSGLLPLCLQVKDEKSLTGIVDYVHIRDSISNEYSFIMDDLRISRLRLFDTYGLDHANWDKDKGKVLSSILYDLQNKKLLKFNSDLAVLYIKKLDSGKPTELKTIIPQIYKMIPQAPVYCLFNGLDIFLGSGIDGFNPYDYLNSACRIPKSVKYLISEDGKNDILKSISSENNFGEYLYSTLKNNIVAFCSDNEIIQKKYNIYDNNKKGVYKLLLSVCMKEYSSMNIIPDEIITSLKDGKYDSKIDKIIEEIFEKSSKTDWEKEHWKTVEANCTRLFKNYKNELGFSGTYNHRWNQLFHRGYVSTINSLSSDFLGVGEGKNYAYAIDACIRNMEEEFLGPSYELAYRDEESPDNEFKKLIKRMYELGTKKGKYIQNPFTVKDFEGGENSLNNVCKFNEGYGLIKDELKKHFKNVLAETIEIENKDKAANLLKINFDFYKQLNNLKFDFDKKYEGVNFYDLLKYYSGDEEKSK